MAAVHCAATMKPEPDPLDMARHEIRRLLSRMSLQLQLALEDLEAAPADAAHIGLLLDGVQRNVNTLAAMLGALLQGRVDVLVHSERCDLAGMVIRVANEYAAAHADRTIVIEAPGCACWVPAPSHQVEQVLTNVLDNAIKFSSSATRIDLSLSIETQRAVVRVRDEGIGLADGLGQPGERAYLRGTNALAAEISGTGLGLYICRDILRQHEGGLSVEPVRDGPGVVVSAWLPVCAD